MKLLIRERTESQSRSDFDPMEDKELNNYSFKRLRNSDVDRDVFLSDEDVTSDDEPTSQCELNKYLTRGNRNGQLQAKHNDLTTPKHSETANLRLHVSNPFERFFDMLFCLSSMPQIYRTY